MHYRNDGGSRTFSARLQSQSKETEFLFGKYIMITLAWVCQSCDKENAGNSYAVLKEEGDPLALAWAVAFCTAMLWHLLSTSQ